MFVLRNRLSVSEERYILAVESLSQLNGAEGRRNLQSENHEKFAVLHLDCFPWIWIFPCAALDGVIPKKSSRPGRINSSLQGEEVKFEDMGLLRGRVCVQQSPCSSHPCG